MLKLGLTGDIAAGKSTVARLLQKCGAAVIDADALVHELYADRDFAARVAALFESAPIQAENGGIDRAALATRVFKDPVALRRLEALVHPAVAELRDKKLRMLAAAEPGPPVCVLEAVKLIESGQHQICDAVWWIRASPETQFSRLVQQRAMGEAAANARLAHQPPAEAKRALLGAVPCVEIENNGSLADLEARVGQEWENLIRQHVKPEQN